MSEKILEKRIFTNGAARYHDLVYILSKDNSMMEKEIAHTSAICVDMGRWADAVNTNWDCTAIAVAKKPEEKMVIVGEDGEVCTYVGGVEKKERTLSKVSMIRSANAINGYVYACGMKRQVFKRVSENKWIDISAPCKKAEKVGFEAIDGFSENEVYAVGWNGEIWKHDGTIWSLCCNLTNVILTAVCCASDGAVYVVGKQGTIIKGRNDIWEIVELEDEVEKDFWGICFYKNKLYISSMSELYTLNKNQLEQVDFKKTEASSFYGLTQAEDVMWSIGARDVLSFDGEEWIRYGA
ncbi:MAG: hypothetical protein HC877_11510 [Thioploca sp.]|nr:hypothetical protein [Thioploca sp.]